MAGVALASPALAASVVVRAAGSGDRAGADQIEPCAAVTEAGYLVAWVEARPGARAVLASTSADGITWTTPAALSGPGAVDEAMRPTCAARGDDAVVAWATAAAGDHDVWAVRSRDGGRSFDRPAVVASGAGGQLAAQAAVGADGRAYVVFHDSFGSTDEDGGVQWHVRLSTSDGGGLWAPATTVDRGRALATFPAVAVSETGRVTVSWLGPEDGTIWAAVSEDRGMGFGVPFLVSSAGAIAEGPPSAAVLADDRVQLVFAASSTAAEQRDPALLVQEDRYLDVVGVETSSRGASIAAPARVLNTTRVLDQLQPAAAGRLTVWLDHALPSVRRIRAAGLATAATEVELTDTGTAARDVALPSVGCDAQSCLVAWSQDGEGGGFDVRASVVR